MPTDKMSEGTDNMILSTSIINGLSSSNAQSFKKGQGDSCAMTVSDLGSEAPPKQMILKPAFKPSRVLVKPNQAQKKYMKSIKRALIKELEAKVKNYGHNPPSMLSLTSLGGPFRPEKTTATDSFSAAKPQWRREARPASALPSAYLPHHTSANTDPL